MQATRKITEIVVRDRIRADCGDVSSLAESMRRLGMLQPIVVNGRNELVAGGRRLTAAKSLGWKEVPVCVADNLGTASLALAAERDENTERQPLKPSELVALGKRLEDLLRPEAEARKAATLKQNAGEGRSGKLPERESAGDTRDKVAAALNVSGKTYEKAKAVVDAAKADPELKPVVEEMDRTGKVDPAYRKVKAGQHEVPNASNTTAEARKPVATKPRPLGVGTRIANEAINLLQQIPIDDPLRGMGFQIVRNYLDHNG